MTGEGTYRKALGKLNLVSLGIGGTVGSGIFIVPGVAAGLMGPSCLFAWAIAGFSAICVMLALAWANRKLGKDASFHRIFSVVAGHHGASLLVLLYLVSAIIGVGTVAAGVGQYISVFGIGFILIVEIGIIAIFMLVNLIGVRLTGVTENLLTVLKIIPVVVIALILLPFVRIPNLVPLTPIIPGTLLATIVIVYWPYTGFEISAIPVEETKDTTIVGGSLMIVMAIVVSLYLLLNVALIGSTGSATLATSSAPIAAAMEDFFPGSGLIVILVGIVAMLSAMNAYLLGASRVLHNLCRIWQIPVLKGLSKRGIPTSSIVVCAALSCLPLLYSNNFTELADISVVTTLIPYFFFCISATVMVPGLKTRIVSISGAFTTGAIGILFLLFP